MKSTMFQIFDKKRMTKTRAYNRSMDGITRIDWAYRTMGFVDFSRDQIKREIHLLLKRRIE